MSETPLGRFCWFELMTTDPRAATSFYRANSRMGDAGVGRTGRDAVHDVDER